MISQPRLIPRLTSDPLVMGGTRVMVGIEVLTARGAKVIPCGCEDSAALHSDAKRKTSVARNILGEHQAGFWVSSWFDAFTQHTSEKDSSQRSIIEVA